jgi:KRAB domain-containing zinc finger protein
MISLIFYSGLFIFMSPVLALELSRGSNGPEVNFSDEQWDLLKNAIFSNPADFTNQEWENKFDSLFNETPELYTETLDAQPIAIPTPKKSSRNTYRTCPLCEKSVSKISVHLRYHKDEYNYPCDQCPCMFKEACNLNKHKKRHETKRPLESETLLGLSANLFGNLNKTGSGTTLQKDKKRKTADDKGREEIEDLNTEFKTREYTPTESAKGVLGKLSLMGEPVSAASMERLARSLEDMAQKNPGGAKALHNHVRLELKIKKSTPTRPATWSDDSTKAKSSVKNKKHVNYPDLNLSNLKKFTCPNCSVTYKRQAFLEKHMAMCTFSEKKSTTHSRAQLPAHHRSASGQNLHAQQIACTSHALDHVLNAESSEVEKYEKKFRCTLCEKKYDRISRLNSHVKTSHRAPETGDIVCAICNKGFKLKRSFENHINLHTGNRPHSCKSCQKSFQTRSQLQHHTHTNCPERA